MPPAPAQVLCFTNIVRYSSRALTTGGTESLLIVGNQAKVRNAAGAGERGGPYAGFRLGGVAGIGTTILDRLGRTVYTAARPDSRQHLHSAEEKTATAIHCSSFGHSVRRLQAPWGPLLGLTV